jgi:hypothetical protein
MAIKMSKNQSHSNVNTNMIQKHSNNAREHMDKNTIILAKFIKDMKPKKSNQHRI